MAGAESGWKSYPKALVNRFIARSEKEKEKETREDLLKHAMDAQVESIKQRNRHDEEMRRIDMEKAAATNKGFICTINDCGTFVSGDEEFGKHFKEWHYGGPCCDRCGAVFDYAEQLDLHSKQYHTDKYSIEDPSGAPDDKQNLQDTQLCHGGERQREETENDKDNPENSQTTSEYHPSTSFAKMLKCPVDDCVSYTVDEKALLIHLQQCHKERLTGS